MASKVSPSWANLGQPSREILTALGPRWTKGNSSSRKINVTSARKKGTSFMIVPTGRKQMLQPARVLMLEKETSGMMLQAGRLDPVLV